jgi:hypothetical protein
LSTQAGIRRKRQQATLVETELIGEGVDPENQLRRADFTCGRGYLDTSTCFETGDRRVFIEHYIFRQIIGEPAHQRRRIEQSTARGVNRRLEMRRTQPFVQIGFVDPGKGFVECFELARERLEHFFHTLVGAGGLILTGLTPVTIDSVTLDLGFVIVDGGACQRHVAVRTFEFIHRAADNMR